MEYELALPTKMFMRFFPNIDFVLNFLSYMTGQNMALMRCAVINGIGLAKTLTAMKIRRTPQINYTVF